MSEETYQFLFTKWMEQHGKEYESDQVFSRYNVFKANLDFIRKHNEGNETYTMGMNEFGDLTWEEFRSTYIGNVVSHRSPFLRSRNVADLSHISTPSSIDWVAKGAVTPVKNQGQCGSCWSFSATGSMEGAHFLKTGKLVSLSEQELVDCSGPEGNSGCNGGLMDYAFEYVIKNGGICGEDAYPYKAVDGSCVASSCPGGKVTTVSGYQDVAQGDENALLSAAAITPVSIAIEADQSSFQFYSGGVFTGPCGTQLDHGVLIVGFGTDSGKNYWKIKNSWGGSWGEAGYIRMIRGKNMCGLTAAASYPTV
jgi:C1A family cysteine protease